MRRSTLQLRRHARRTGACLMIALGVASGAIAGAHPGQALASPTTRCPTGTRARTALARCPALLSGAPTLTLEVDQAAQVNNDSLAGTLRGATGALLDPIGTGAGALAGVGLGAIDSWVLTGAGAALNAAAKAISTTTSPQLESTWFSSTYWRVAGIGAVLTLPFLFAAATQALLRSDLSLLVRSAFGYLPLALVGVGLAAPLTMLLLAATDQLCSVMSPAGSNAGAHFLTSAALATTGVSALDGSDFLAFVVGLFTVAAAVALLLELLVREAAVYVVVLMLPLAFAAFVWPARRIWAIRMLELLIALIVSKFAVVAVLALGGAAYGNGTDDPGRLLTAMALVILSTFAPWAMLRLIPFTEIAAGASNAIHSELPRLTRTAAAAGEYAGAAIDWLPSVTASMRTNAREAGQTGERAPLTPTGRSSGSELADRLGAAGRGDGPPPLASPTDASPLAGAADSSALAGAPEAAVAFPRSTADPGTEHRARTSTEPAGEGPGPRLADIGSSPPADYSAAPLWLGLEGDRPPWAQPPGTGLPSTGSEQQDPLPEQRYDEDRPS